MRRKKEIFSNVLDKTDERRLSMRVWNYMLNYLSDKQGSKRERHINTRKKGRIAIRMIPF